MTRRKVFDDYIEIGVLDAKKRKKATKRVIIENRYGSFRREENKP